MAKAEGRDFKSEAFVKSAMSDGNVASAASAKSSAEEVESSADQALEKVKASSESFGGSFQGILLVSSARRFANSICEALTQEHANEMADGIASILGEEMQGLEKRQHSSLVWFSLMRR